MCLALRASGLWLRYATLQNLIPSFLWIAPGWRAWGRNPREGKGSNFANWQPCVQAVPTVIAMRDGQVVDKFVGLIDEDKLGAFVEKLKS